MYQALYRKYRSQTFGQLVGQQVVATTLRQAVEQGKISHAYLFSGPRGTGKTSVAKIFAKAMNCPNQKDGEPCNDCYICKAITEGSLEDVIEIDAASNNGVDEIRDIRDKSTYAPSMAKHKVYIIDEVHMLSTGAFNALLKTLEEPTENVVFILATTELHKIPATILSRVQRFEFKSIKTQDIIAHIEWILEQEGIDFEQEGVQIIARRAEGGMRDALSILDQALSLTQENRLTTDIAEEITGSISLGALDAYVAALISHDAVTALDNLNLIFDSGKNMVRFVTDLLQYLRDLIIVKTGGENHHASELFLENLKTPQETLFAMIDMATKSLPDIKNSLQPKIYTEMMTIRLAETSSLPTATAIPDNLADELKGLRQEIDSLKQQLANVNAKPVATVKTSDIRPQKSKGYRVDRNKVNAILAFESNFNAEQTMKRDNLNTMFGNILSNAAGFSPEILAISLEEWTKIRADFSARSRNGKVEVEEKKEEKLIPEGFDFLAEKITVQED